MHIGVICDPQNFHTQKWSLALQDAGAQVTLFSFSDYVYDRVPCVKVEPRLAVGGKIHYGCYLASGQRLYDALKAHKVDIVNPVNITPYGVWATRSGFKPMAAVSMGADILEYPPDKSMSPLQTARSWSNAAGKMSLLRKLRNLLSWRVFRRLVGKSLQAADFITGDNLVLTDAVHDWFGVAKEKIHLNRWGVEPDLFEVPKSRLDELRLKYGIKPGQKVVLSPRGAMAIYQGDIILEAFKKLLQKGYPNVKFIMFSAGYNIPEAVDRLATELEERHDNFYFVRGMIPRREVLEIWPLVDLFISAPVYDGYSNAVGEGRYIGAIPVVNAIPGNVEIITHDYNGWMVDPFTADNLSEGLSTILADLSGYQARYQTVNRQWIEENGMLATNIDAFLQLCRQTLEKYGKTP